MVPNAPTVQPLRSVQTPSFIPASRGRKEVGAGTARTSNNQEEIMKDVTIVVGTVGQSIMRSEDNGQTWARIGPRRGFAYEASVRCIAMNPKRHEILFAGTERGLYRSEDRGANWQYIDSALNPHYIWAIGIDSVNPDNMYVGTGTPTPA